VAENGAVVCFPKTGGKTVLGKENSGRIKKAFGRQQGFFVREAIVATTVEHLEKARAVLDENGLSGISDIELNRRDVMIMPKGVNKEKGLAEALRMMGIRRESAACIGDGENDLSLFRACGYRVAVANAVGVLKERADFICSKPYGEGVAEFIVRLCQEYGRQ